MAKERNLLLNIFEKSWKLDDEQMTKLVDEAAAIFEWMNEIIPAAEEAVNRKTACTLPKTPSVKRRKIDETQIKQEQAKSALDDNEKHEVVEDKRPRQLKPRRNTKTKNRRSSKPRRSKQVCKKVVTEVRQSTRITRATHKNDALENSVFEKDARAPEDDVNVSATTQSNTTKSFVEHEKDMEVNGETEERTSACFIKLVNVLDENNDKNSNKTKNPPVTANVADSVSIKEMYPVAVEEQPKPETNKMQKRNDGEKDATVIKCRLDEKGSKNEEILKSGKLMTAKDYTSQKDKAEIDAKVGSHDEIQETAQGDAKLAAKIESPRSVCPQGKIAKIKERLFEKITMPSSSTPTRQSPRLKAIGRDSPRLGKSPIRAEGPKTLDSPIVKRKIIEQLNSEKNIELVTEESTQNQDLNYIDGGDEGVNIDEKDANIDGPLSHTGPKIIKPIKPKNLLTGVHSMIKDANQKNNIHQGPVAKQGNLVTGLFSFIKPNANEKKPETTEERKQRLEEETKKREAARMKLIQQAEQRKQKEIEERKKRRQEREQRVAEAQARKAQEEKERQEWTQKRFEMMKKNEEKVRKNKEKEEEMKKKNRERKMAEAEAKRKQEESERLAKMAEKEEEERRKAEYLQRKQEYEELERRKKIEEQKKAEEQRLEEHAKELQLQEERLRREMEEREAQVRKRLEEKEREQEKKRMEKEKQEKEMQERLKKEAMEKEKAEQERLEKELQEKLRIRENEAKEKKLKEEREEKERELKERKEREMKAAREKEAKEREAYYRKKLEQKRLAEPKRTFDKADLEMKQTMMKSPTQPAPHQKVEKIQCTSYHTPTLTKVKSKVKKKSPSLQTIDLNDLSEDDSTDDDDDDDPAGAIPSWAKPANSKKDFLELVNIYNPREIFVNILEPPKLEKMFPKLRARFFKRTSSACWDHPPRPVKSIL